MKRILFAPFYSMRSYSSGKWLLAKDGHATQCRNMIKALSDRSDLEFDIVVPLRSDVEIVQDFFCTYNIKDFKCKVNLIHNTQYQTNALNERLNFNYVFWSSLFNQRKKYDIIIYNNIENVRNIRAIVGNEVKIISAVTHTINMDIDSPHYFLHRIIDGIHASDFVWYNTTDTWDLLMHHVYDLRHSLIPCFAYASSDEFTWPYMIKELKSVLFLSRLTDEKRTNANLLLDIIDRDLDYQFYITNPSDVQISLKFINYINDGRLKILEQKNRTDYIRTLYNMKYVVILYDTEKSFSTAYHEALLADCNVITLKHNQHQVNLNSPLSLSSLDIDEIISKLGQEVYGLKNEVIKEFDVKTQVNKLIPFI